MIRRRIQKREIKNPQQAQSFLEYAIIFAAVALIMFAMTPMIRRAFQGMVKVAADQLGVQKTAEQTFDETGYMEGSNVYTTTVMDKTTSELEGSMQYQYDDSTVTTIRSTINMGFTEEYNGT